MHTIPGLRDRLEELITQDEYWLSSTPFNRRMLASPIRQHLDDVEALMPDASWPLGRDLLEDQRLWLEERTDLKPNTHRNYDRAFKAFAAEVTA